REEMAEILVRAFGYEHLNGLDPFVDDEDSPFEDSINALEESGITVGCNPPDNTEFCPERSLTRAEMATFFARALEIGR
ncbi:MAG: S-layer homology domain-containing protein, partial [Acidimicrobiia bacterium]